MDRQWSVAPGCAPVTTFQQHRQLCWCDGHLAVGRRRPNEPALLQAPGKQARASAVEPDHLDQTTAAAPEHEQISRERVFGQSLFRKSGKTVDPLRMSVTPGRPARPWFAQKPGPCAKLSDQIGQCIRIIGTDNSQPQTANQFDNHLVVINDGLCLGACSVRPLRPVGNRPGIRHPATP